jgi:hypothetical protein
MAINGAACRVQAIGISPKIIEDVSPEIAEKRCRNRIVLVLA